jgi:sialidase-1
MSFVNARASIVFCLSCATLAVTARAADFETGIVIKADGATHERNAIPCVARMGNGSLIAVWTASAKGQGIGHVYGAISSDSGKTWSGPRLLIKDDVMKDGDPNLVVDTQRVFVYSTRVEVPNRITRSSVHCIYSDDFGQTWSPPQNIDIARRYVVGKQHKGIKLRDGTFLMGIAWDKWPEQGMAAKAEGEMNLCTGVLISRDALKWTLHGNIHAYVEKITPFGTNGLCEPALVELADGEIFMLLRSGSARHYESRSRDSGLTWSAPVPSALPGHNTPSSLWRLEQSPHEIIVAWNSAPLTRYPLSVALSNDGGKTWSRPRIVATSDSQQVSYPSLTQTQDGLIFLVWQAALADGGRDIRWARFSRTWLVGE